MGIDQILEFVQGVGVTRIILIGLLCFGLISFAVVHTFGPTFDKKVYSTFRPAWPNILILWTASAIAIGQAIRLAPADWAPQVQLALADPSKVVFLVYLVGFASMWAVYFASRRKTQVLRVRTLRSFLLRHSLNFGEEDEGEVVPEANVLSENEARAKAQTSATAVAFMVAVAVVVVNLVNDTSGDPEIRNDLWAQSMLFLAASCAIVSFYAFIVAADTLESVFNKFKNDPKNVAAVRFYKRSLNPKYYGMVLMMASLAFFVAARFPELGALCFAVASLIGYCHWFPAPLESEGSAIGNRVIRIAMVVLPIGLSLHSFYS